MLIGIITAVVTLVLAVPVVFSMRWVVDQLPFEAVLLLCGVVAGGCGGFYIGQWDGRRQRTPGND